MRWGVVALMLAAGPMADEAQVAADRAQAALAQRLEVSAEAIEVLQVKPAEWPNAALGCPEKGQMYAQVLTSGYRVELGYAGRSHWLHVAGRQVVTCGGASSRASGRAGRGSALEPMARVSKEARRDLAQRLGIDEAEVKIERLRRLKEGALLDECPADAEPTPGEDRFQITLQAGGQTYRYLAIGERLVFCETS